jgi:myo-inositol-1(or 4)-monophosphatase
MTEQQRLLEECRQVAEEAAMAGGQVLLAHRYAPLEIEHKDRQEVVTNVDRLSDETICALLRRAFPKHAIVSEESGVQDSASPYRWIVDPLDGTESYIRGQHFSVVTIALTYANETVLGVVYHPFHNELYTALADGPTTVNGHPVQVTSEVELSQARLILDYSPRDDVRQRLNDLEWDRGIKQMMRFGGSFALNVCQVAKGAADGYFYGRMRNRVKSWDMAAAALLVQRAGGSVLDRQGQPLNTLEPQGFVLCYNAKIALERLCCE